MTLLRYPIKLAALQTGLSEYVIRIWEQRYRAVEPERTASNRRLYTPAQIARLQLLRQVTQAGHGIGQVAQLSHEQLSHLAAGRAETGFPPEMIPQDKKQSAGAYLEECLRAVEAMRGQALEAALLNGEIALGRMGLLQHVVAPLAQTIGELWRKGDLTAAQEHFATAVLRVFLGNASRPHDFLPAAPLLTVATPTGQIHELGALLVSTVAANLGWRVTYLGPSLPAAEIAGAARNPPSRAVALSLVYPDDDPALPSELSRLREALPARVALLAGGRAAASYKDALKSVGAILVNDLDQLGLALDNLRKTPGTD